MPVTISLAERMSWISESSTMKVSAAADKLKAEGVDVIVFGAGEPDFPTPDNIKKAAETAIENNFTRYTAASGTLELKKAVCERHRIDFGTGYAPGECCISVGGKHSIFNLMQILINPGDEVVIPSPYWVTYADVVAYSQGKSVFVETREADGFEVTAAMIEKAVTPKTKLVIVNSPNNPTGAVLAQEEFARIVDLANRKGIYVLTDECYSQLVYDGKPYSAAAFPEAKNTVIVSGSLSKNYAMTGWRIGFTLSPAPIAKAMGTLQSQSTSNPTSVAQKAAVEALTGPQGSIQVMLAEYKRRRDFVVARLNTIPGVTCAMPKGAFYAYPNISSAFGKGGIQNSLDFAEQLLEKASVAAVPGAAFGTDEYLRISYATSMSELERGLDRIDQFMRGLA
ncbi:MAG: pyridoxal phosphate-dependent aminotransferase [Bryobacterales bacterium]|nr:pyridoxal phosphate-dependent aminotransferase [Bryobacterales bacterium]